MHIHNVDGLVILDDQADAAYSPDCDCACPSSLPPVVTTSTLAQVVLPTPPPEQIALDREHSVVFVPSFSRVAVLNRTALALLKRCVQPQRLDDLPPALAAAAQHMVALGLLTPPGVPLPGPAAPDELVAWLHVTNACNLRCTYCYIEKSDEAMSAETAYAAIDAVVRSARQHGYRRVLLKYAGGEASLNLPLVTEMQRYATEQAGDLHIRGVVLSNGVGLTRHKLTQIRTLGLRLMISLDGPAAAHNAQRPTRGGRGSYAAVVATIERARDLGLDLTISVTITGTSVADLPAVVGWLLERDLHFSLNFYREHDCSTTYTQLQLDEAQIIAGMCAAYAVVAERLPRYNLLGCLLDRTNLGSAHARTCAVGENYLVIDQRGGIAKCQMEIDRPVTNIWADNPLGVIRLTPIGVQNIAVDDKIGCRTCRWKYWCAGGCAVATFRATGRYDIQSPNCAIYQALYPEVLRLEGLRLLHWYRRQQSTMA